jgi:hypothetical protein
MRRAAEKLVREPLWEEFEYMGFHFRPMGKVRGDFSSIIRKCGDILLSRFEKKPSDIPLLEETQYSHEGFYKAANSEDDIFRCIEEDGVYIPCENYLFRYMGREARQNG